MKPSVRGFKVESGLLSRAGLGEWLWWDFNDINYCVSMLAHVLIILDQKLLQDGSPQGNISVHYSKGTHHFYYICLLLKTKFFYIYGQLVRPYETVRSLFVNFGILELTYRLQTFRDYSYSSQVPCEKRSNSLINTGTSVRPS